MHYRRGLLVTVLALVLCGSGALSAGNWKKGEEPANMAIVLLSEPRLPDSEAITRAFRDFGATGEDLRFKRNYAGKRLRPDVLPFELNTGEGAFVALMADPLPVAEAEHWVRSSVSSFGNRWKLPPYSASLLVTFHSATESSRLVQLSRFTSLVAAVTKASPAVGVYWDNARATHDSQFFLTTASRQGISPRMVLWSGISVAREKDGRLSLLSLGMEKQLNLPNLLLVAGKSSEDVALVYMYSFLACVAEQGKELPEGATVGVEPEEKFPIRYVEPPVKSFSKVWRVDLP